MDVSERVREEAMRVTASLASSLPSARWVSRENLHVTLSFLGSTGVAASSVAGAMRVAASRAAPLSLRLTGVGGFPSSRRARVVWIGLGGDVAALTRLAGDVARALEPLGFPAQERDFSAHLTLARLREPAAVPDVPVEPVELLVSAVVLYRSDSGRDGPLYEPLATEPLPGASAGP